MVGAGTNKSKSPLTHSLSIILVRPQLAVNIGMCARAMANFGLSDLRLVAPKCGWPPSPEWHEAAISSAAGAAHILEGLKLYDTLDEAIADLNYVWASTARERGQAKPVLSPKVAMTQAASGFLQGERHGILFGPERTGLENDEVGVAHAILTFPVDPAYASLNLAQAVLLTAYEFFQASTGDLLPYAAPNRSPPAPYALTASFFEYVENALDEVGFFRPPQKKPIMARNLRNMFNRMSMSVQDVRTLRGAFVRLIEGRRKEP